MYRGTQFDGLSEGCMPDSEGIEMSRKVVLADQDLSDIVTGIVVTSL